MIKLCVLGSGSLGNSIYIGDEKSGILLDSGFSARETNIRLKKAGINPDTIRAILVTHEHSDHVRGVGVISRSLKAPIYINHKTYKRAKNIIGEPYQTVFFETGVGFEVAGMEAHSFSVPHDASDPCAFVFRQNGVKVGVAIDTGSVTMLMEQKIHDADYVVIEANHDPAMLQAGPYPWVLKQRIASKTGHLSNETCMNLIKKIANPNLQGVTFAHLSKQNNNPDLVRIMADETLAHGVSPFNIASQDEPGDVIYVQ